GLPLGAPTGFRSWTRARSDAIGTDRPPISELQRGQLARFSLETLIRYLARLQHRVDVTVTPDQPVLLSANDDQRIRSCGSKRRHETRNRRDDGQRDGHDDKRQRV